MSVARDQLASVPAELRKRDQWVIWRREQRDDKSTKVPYVATDPGRRASSTDPATWASCSDAIEAGAAGIGFVFSAEDPYTGIDLDAVIVQDGSLHPAAAAIVEQLDSYTERSPSGRGVHVIVKAQVNGSRNRTGKTSWGDEFEAYDHGRFFCMTGDRLDRAPVTIEPRQAELDAVLAQMFPTPSANGSGPPAAALEMDDAELLERAFAARNGAKLEALYRGDASGYGSASEADLALCSLLAFWTGPDPERLDRLIRASNVYRSKWNAPRGDSTYGRQTIERALEGRSDFYSSSSQPTVAPAGQSQASEPTLRFSAWADLRAAAPPAPPWVLEDYCARGTVTLAAGKPKSGKSTLACSIAEAIDARAATFLGRKVDGGPVVYLSEEGAATLAPKLAESARSTALTRDAAFPKPSWADVITAAVAEAERIHAVLLVIDALAFWAAFAEGAEKDAGQAQATMDALGAATGAGLAVLLVHHQRKSGGEDGDAVRGSGAIFGAVDVLIELERVGEEAPPGHRRLVSIGRWPTTPPVLVIDRDAGEWRVVGQAATRQSAATLSIREQVLAAMPAEPPGVTEAELVELMGLDKRRVGPPLRELVNDGLVSRTGAGARGNPYRYEKVSEKVSRAGTQLPGEKVSYPLGGDTFSSSSVSVRGTQTDTIAPPTLEDAVLDADEVEWMRASVDGEWIDQAPANALVLDYTGRAA